MKRHLVAITNVDFRYGWECYIEYRILKKGRKRKQVHWVHGKDELECIMAFRRKMWEKGYRL